MLQIIFAFLAVILAAVIVGGIYYVREFGIARALIELSKHDEWWSPVRPKPPAGQYAIMAKSLRNGTFDRIIHSIKGHYVDGNGDFAMGADPAGPDWFEVLYGEKLGLVWVGFFKQYFIRPTEYAAIDTSEKGSKYVIVPKKRNMKEDDPYYFFQYSTMAVQAEKAEISGNLTIDADLIVTARHRNPYKVHFLAGKWTVRVVAAVERGVKEFVRNKDFDTIRQEHAKGLGGLVQTLKHLGDVRDDKGNLVPDPDLDNPASENLTAKYGLEIDDPDFVKFDLTPGDPRAKEALEEKEIQRLLADAAEEENKKKIRQAEGDRAANRIRAEGVQALLAARRAEDPTGILSIGQALDKQMPTTLVLGNSNIAIPTSQERKIEVVPK